LFIDDLCEYQTDSDLRTALSNLPPSLTRLLDRKLDRIQCRQSAGYSLKFLQCCGMTKRPLTPSEFRDLLGLQPDQRFRDVGKLIHDVSKTIAATGGLLYVDVEEQTVHYENHWQGRKITDIHITEPTQFTPLHELDEFEAWATPHNYYSSQAVTVDDYEAYKSSPAIPINDVIGWWRDHQTTYPKLSQMAFDLLSIPAMSAECERVFSLAKLVITTQRHGLSDSTIEAIQCMKNWLDRNAVQ
jgi:hypothetical protein